MDMATCDISAMGEEVAGQFQDAAAGKGQKLLFYHSPAQPALVKGNDLRLRQVVSNLIGNAIKYTPEEGEIHLAVRLEDSIVLLSVKDNGMGIPTNDLPYIFDRFYRVESDETADIQGTGLGLSICKSVVEKHGGRIWAESTLGKESVFFVALPAVVQNPATNDQQSVPKATVQAA